MLGFNFSGGFFWCPTPLCSIRQVLSIVFGFNISFLLACLPTPLPRIVPSSSPHHHYSDGKRRGCSSECKEAPCPSQLGLFVVCCLQNKIQIGFVGRKEIVKTTDHNSASILCAGFSGMSTDSKHFLISSGSCTAKSRRWFIFIAARAAIYCALY